MATNEEIIQETLKVLNDNVEWHERYADYAESLLEHEDEYRKMANRFRVKFPLSAYTTITKARHGFEYDIRFLGQSIGNLSIEENGTKYERKFKFAKGYNDLRNRYSDLPELDVKEEWDSDKMIKCRSCLQKIAPAVAKTHSPEHKCENLLLREFSRTRNATFPYINPVRFARTKYVQVTTPLNASKKNKVSYSKCGGGIDILARVGHGSNSNLCVIELKDENKSKEPMSVVIQQALSYAVFIALLLDDERTKDWWKVFGYNGKREPKHVIDVVGLMPKGTEEEINAEYQVGTFTLHVHSLYFDKEALEKRERVEFSGSYAEQRLGIR